MAFYYVLLLFNLSSLQEEFSEKLSTSTSTSTLLLKLRGLFIETRRGLEALGIPEKSSIESSCPSRRLIIEDPSQSYKEFIIEFC
jgi:hypothetical protein